MHAIQVAASPTVTAVREEDLDQEWIEKEKKIESSSEDLQVARPVICGGMRRGCNSGHEHAVGLRSFVAE